MKRGNFPFAVLLIAALLPLLALAGAAWWGTRAQIRTAWATAREEAEAEVVPLAQNMGTLFGKSVRTAAIFPDPPPPGAPGKPDDPLATDDPEALRKLRDNPQAGLSPAGLPRRAIAAVRILEKTNSREDADKLLQLAVIDAPSVLSARMIRQVRELFPKDADHPLVRQWERDERARRMAEAHPEVGDGGRFFPIEGNPIPWFSREGDTIRYIDPESVWANRLSPSEGNKSAARHWGGVKLTADGVSLYEIILPKAGRKSGDPAPILATATIPFGRNFQISITAADPDVILAGARAQARWTSALLLFAVAISGTSLWLMHRTLSRERRLNALKSDFVASVSHELRAPIASIRLMADALEEGKIQQGTAHEFHRLISREGARLSTLIENVLDFARIEQGKKQWRMEETDLRSLLADTVTLMEPLAAEKQIRLISRMPEGCSASVDPDSIRQALVNLLDNAIKFSPPDSEILLALKDDPDAVRIVITDKGPGIPKEEHSRIFEKFHRLGGELRRETQGTGIGLSLVKAIAEAHSGRVELESEPGKGSAFTLILPKQS